MAADVVGVILPFVRICAVSMRTNNGRTVAVIAVAYWLLSRQPFCSVCVVGGAENAGVENVGVDSRGGKCRSRQQGWKMHEWKMQER